MPASSTFNANLTAAEYIPLMNELANGIFTVAAAQGTNFTAVKGYLYPLSATGLTVTLPLSPTAGDRIRFAATTASVVSVTFDRNGSLVNGAAANKTIAGSWVSLALEAIYLGGSTGWLIIENADAAGVFEVKSAGFTAVSGGTYALTASTFTVTLPASPAAGAWVRVFAGDDAVTAITLDRNGAPINSAASNVTVNAKQWDCVAYYVNGTIGWLLRFGTTINPGARWDSTLRELRYHNSQRELSATAGWAPYAYPLHTSLADAGAGNVNLAANGGSVAVPVDVRGHMLLQAVTVRNGDTTTQRDLEWRLYKQRLNNGNSGENTLDEVPGANGTLSFTPAASPSNRTSTPSSPPIYLAPGVYWLVLRNTSASQTFATVVPTVSALSSSANLSQTKTLGSALGASLDFVAATWTKRSDYPLCRLDGRVFGQTAAF